MVNYHDPVAVAREFGAYVSPSGYRGLYPDQAVGLLNSGGREALAFRRWYICVRLPILRANLCLTTRPWHSASRWEFVTTLDYEWSVFQGNRPCGRSIWVRSLFGGGFLIVHLTTEDSTLPAKALLPHALVHTRGRNSQHGRL